MQDSIPLPKKKMLYEDLAETAVVVFKHNQVLLRRCQEGERWAGLWDFPRFVSDKQKSARHDRDEVKRLTGVDVDVDPDLVTMKHGVTKYRITLSCRSAKFVSGRLRRDVELAWVSTKSLDEYPLSVTGRKIAKWLK